MVKGPAIIAEWQGAENLAYAEKGCHSQAPTGARLHEKHSGERRLATRYEAEMNCNAADGIVELIVVRYVGLGYCAVRPDFWNPMMVVDCLGCLHPERLQFRPPLVFW